MLVRVRENHNFGGARAGAEIEVSEEEARLHPEALEPVNDTAKALEEFGKGGLPSGCPTCAKIRTEIAAPADEYPDLSAAVKMLHGEWQAMRSALLEQQQEADRLRAEGAVLRAENAKLAQDIAEARSQLEAGAAPRKGK